MDPSSSFKLLMRLGSVRLQSGTIIKRVLDDGRGVPTEISDLASVSCGCGCAITWYLKPGAFDATCIGTPES